MKKKEKESLRGMSEAELVKHIRSLESEIAKAKLDRAAKQLKNTRVFRAKRRSIAVARTILHERQLVR